MALDPILQAMVDNSKAQGRTQSLAEGGLQQARDAYAMMRAAGGQEAPIASVDDRAIPGPAGDIPIRIYTPEGEAPFPVVVYFHGGGFTIGSVDSHDPVTRRMASESGAIVVSVDYRLAPEGRFPAAVDDCFAALQWIGDNASTFGGDPSRLAVAGDSAGGNLAAVTSIMAREAGGPNLALQVLVYPTTDVTREYPSHKENADGPFLTADTMRWFWEQYQPDASDWRASPIVADLSNLPPALVVTGQYDPLRDEGKAYADKLRDAGNTVTYHNYETMPHVFLQLWGVLPAAKELSTEIAEALRKAFAA